MARGDALVQAWLDRRYLATIQKLMIEHEAVAPRYLSEVVRYAVEVFVDSAVSQGLVSFVESTSEATEMLSKFRVELNPSGRGLKNLQINLQNDPGTRMTRSNGLDELVKQELERRRKE